MLTVLVFRNCSAHQLTPGILSVFFPNKEEIQNTNFSNSFLKINRNTFSDNCIVIFTRTLAIFNTNPCYLLCNHHGADYLMRRCASM